MNRSASKSILVAALLLAGCTSNETVTPATPPPNAPGTTGSPQEHGHTPHRPAGSPVKTALSKRQEQLDELFEQLNQSRNEHEPR